MSKYKTALGRTIDMAALAAKNEHTRAVGNMKVNARGDTIDSMGRIVKSVTAKVNDGYAKTVGNRGARAQPENPQRVAVDPVSPPSDQIFYPVAKAEEIAEFKPDTETTLAEDITIEEIKAKEVAKVAPTKTKTSKDPKKQ